MSEPIRRRPTSVASVTSARRLFLPVRLAARLHVDLLRMSSALCRG